jgi:PAS domain S-box-containing protein
MSVAATPVPVALPMGWQAAFRLLFETTPTPVAIVDEQRRLVDLNAAAQQLLGRSATTDAGEPVASAIAAAERDRSQADWLQLMREGRASGTRTLLRGDDSEVRVSFVAVVEVLGEGVRAIYTMTPAGGQPREANGAAPGATVLTNRERQVVRLIADGLDTAEIAAALHVSPNTIRSHVRNAMSKLGARTRAQLVAHALGGGRPRGGTLEIADFAPPT